jgi:hypothetical protein
VNAGRKIFYSAQGGLIRSVVVYRSGAEQGHDSRHPDSVIVYQHPGGTRPVEGKPTELVLQNSAAQPATNGSGVTAEQAGYVARSSRPAAPGRYPSFSFDSMIELSGMVPPAWCQRSGKTRERVMRRRAFQHKPRPGGFQPVQGHQG